MLLRRFSNLVLVFTLGAVAVACSAVATSTPLLTLLPSTTVATVPTILPVTETTRQPVVVATSAGASVTQVPSTVLPSLPTTTSAPPATRVNFTPGATFAVVNGNLAAQSAAYYVLSVTANQLMEVSFNTPNPTQPQIVITGADGVVLSNSMSTPSFFRGTVPTTQNYTIRVTTGDQAMSYAMTIMIPQRITFAQGATEVDVQGKVSANSNYQYVINLQANQLVNMSFSTQAGIHTSLYGVDGDVLQSGMGGGAGFVGRIPTTQDYIIQVVPEGQPVAYTMSVVVPVRIIFAVGATSASLSGSLAAHDIRHFIVNAQAGQQLEVVFTPEASAKMSIYGVDGSVLWSGMGQATHFAGKLPSAQDYYIVFQSGDQPVQFQLKVTIS